MGTIGSDSVNVTNGSEGDKKIIVYYARIQVTSTPLDSLQLV